jgi:hypothetical protein
LGRGAARGQQWEFSRWIRLRKIFSKRLFGRSFEFQFDIHNTTPCKKSGHDRFVLNNFFGVQRPEIINDRGRQMKAKPIQRLCEDHGMPQLFARPRTPNDNPFIESAFSTVKRAPEYPGRFLDDAQAVAYFKRYFTWYDTEHYHSGIDYVTPQQAHDGQRQIIVEQRRAKKLAQRRRRRVENQKPKTGPRKNNNRNIIMPADLVV